MKKDTSIKNLTSKQEKFALLVFKGNGLSEAYRAVYACANMKPGDGCSRDKAIAVLKRVKNGGAE